MKCSNVHKQDTLYSPIHSDLHEQFGALVVSTYTCAKCRDICTYNFTYNCQTLLYDYDKV